LISTDQPAERPATMEDMRRFWPDKTAEELEAAAAAVAEAGGEMTVVTVPAESE